MCTGGAKEEKKSKTWLEVKEYPGKYLLIKQSRENHASVAIGVLRLDASPFMQINLQL